MQPDPPVGLNWTLLNVSLTSTYYDIMLSWKPPQSADVEMGWMTLQYEVQYRDVSSDLWEVVGVRTTSFKLNFIIILKHTVQTKNLINSTLVDLYSFCMFLLLEKDIECF